MTTKRSPACALLLMLATICSPVPAQEGSGPGHEQSIIVEDEFNRGTPLRSADGFLSAAEAGDYVTAAEYLDLRYLRGEAREMTGEQLARRLDIVLERAHWIDVHPLADSPEGRSGDGLPAYRDSIGSIRVDGRNVRLLMQKVPRSDGAYVWKVSNATVIQVPDLYSEYGFPDFIEVLRRSLPNVVFLGLELFKWVVLVAAAGISYAIVYLSAIAFRRAVAEPDAPSHRRIFRFLVVPFGIWVTVIVANATAEWLGRGEIAEAIAQRSPVMILITVWVLFAAVNFLRDSASARLEAMGKHGAQPILSPAGNAINLLIVIGGALAYMDKLGINITTVLAGLGVGGLAVALALQKPLEDVFGAITLYTQQPFRVGDFCRIGDALGTVESIGLRTTKIRTLDNTLIAAPNAMVAGSPIDNISARERILYRPKLRLKYDSTPEQVRQILKGIHRLLESHERVSRGDYRVRFKEIADDALVIEVWAHLETPVWAEYLEIVEELNIQFLDVITEAGTTLGIPTTAFHLEGASAIADAET